MSRRSTALGYVAAWASVFASAQAASASAAAADRPQTIPALQQWAAAPEGGIFTLAPNARVVLRPQDRRTLREEARQLAEDLGTQLGRTVSITARRGVRARGGDVVLGSSGADPRLGTEGYSLRIGRAFTITAPSQAGVFYGGRSLLQLLKGGRPIPRGRARDWPRYPQRGLMVDNGRKYYTPQWLAAQIRELAYLKENYLHLHLSDAQGFRIESDTHPEIVSPQHLTKADIRSLLALARRQHVTVVPEIDMPGHLTAALAKHPELQLADAAGQREAGVLDVANPAAVKFARDLVTEYLQLFDGPFWHLGADEVLPFAEYPLGRFPGLEAQARRRYGPKANAKDAIHGFINDMDALVRAHGKTARMWHDDVGGGSAVMRNPDIVTEWWIDASPLSDLHPPTPQELLDAGHKIVNAGWFPTYVVNGVGGSPLPIRPNLQTAYEQWQVNRFYGLLVADANLQKPPDTVAPDEPGNLGSIVHLWNDNPTLTTEKQDSTSIAPVLRIVAQKTWDSPPLTSAYADFTPIADRLGHAPGYDIDTAG